MSQIKVNRTNGETDTLEFVSPNESYIRISNIKSNKRIFVSFNHEQDSQNVLPPASINTEIVHLSSVNSVIKGFLNSRDSIKKQTVRAKVKKVYSR